MTPVPCVRFRSSVVLDPLTPALARLLGALDTTARQLGVDLTVTCGREAHGFTDPHTTGGALDVSVRNLTPDLLVHVRELLMMLLGAEFTVLYEVPTQPDNATLRPIAYVNAHATGPHFHLQRKKGTVYPPQDVEPPLDSVLDA